MNFQDIIRKRDGHSLSKIEIDYLVKGISDGRCGPTRLPPGLWPYTSRVWMIETGTWL